MESAPNTAAVAEFNTALGDARRVLIAGGYGCGNIGDEAILSVLLAEPGLREREPTVVSRDASATARLHGVRSVSARPVQLARALGGNDALVIGGGGIFSAYMGRRSMLLPALAFAAVAARKRVLFRAIGVYSRTPRHVGRALALAMEHASFASVRDEASVRALRGFGLRGSLTLEPDPALRLRAEPYSGALPERAVGFALRRVRGPALQAALEPACSEAIAAVERAGRTPVLLPFCEHPSERLEQDASYMRELKDRAGSRSAVILEGLTPGQLLGVCGSLEALVAMRFHAIVFAHVAGTRAVTIPYDEKCSAFAMAHAMPSLLMHGITGSGIVAALGLHDRVGAAA
jgi:polysaccharide pyruvyl transferase CsaB